MTTTTTDTAWDTYWAGIGSEAWLTAKALLELSFPLRREAESWIAGAQHDRDGLWEWIANVDNQGRGWSSTEHRLFLIVAALIDPWPDRPDGPIGLYEVEKSDGTVERVIPMVNLLDNMGSWEGDVWRILTGWGTGGNNREHPGRWTAVQL